jgi:hypothetical protein
MEGEIVQGNIGSVGSYDVEFKGGKLVLTAGVEKETTPGVGIKADISIEVEAGKIVDAIERAIPGQIDDVVLEILKKALGI